VYKQRAQNEVFLNTSLIQTSKVGRSSEMVRLQASSGGYLVRGAPDPNHLSDAPVRQMAVISTTACTQRLCRMPFFCTRSTKTVQFQPFSTSVYKQRAQNEVFLYTLDQNRPIPALSHERVHPDFAECGFLYTLLTAGCKCEPIV
jgi:hypothetical protein